MRASRVLALVVFAALPAACVVAQPGGPYGQPAAVSVNSDIAFGYADGYWDRNHQWHPWRDRREAEAWRAQNPGHYYDRRHDQEANAGWHADDRWWERR